MGNEIHDAIHGARAERLNLLYKSFGSEKPNDDTIQKGEENENPFEKAAQEADLEKSDVMNAIQYGGDIKVVKTGKEIKKQVTEQSVRLGRNER